MIILEDTRQKPKMHDNIAEYCEANDIMLKRTKLFVGDYTLPTNQAISIDTKQGMGEVYCDLVQDHARFKRECQLAQECGIRLIILTEDGEIKSLDNVHKWQNPRVKRWYMIDAAHKRGKMINVPNPQTPPISSERLQRMMETMSERYGVEFKFCDRKDTGEIVIEILTEGEKK